MEQGQSRSGNHFRKCIMVLNTGGQYPKSVAMECFNETCDTAQNIPVGATVKVQFSVESREWEGRWFTSAKAFNIFAQQQPQNKYAPPAMPQYPQQPAYAPQQPVQQQMPFGQPQYPQPQNPIGFAPQTPQFAPNAQQTGNVPQPQQFPQGNGGFDPYADMQPGANGNGDLPF